MSLSDNEDLWSYSGHRKRLCEWFCQSVTYPFLKQQLIFYDFVVRIKSQSTTASLVLLKNTQVMYTCYIGRLLSSFKLQV